MQSKHFCVIDNPLEGNAVIQQIDGARVYSYIKTSHMAGYILLLVASFAVSLVVMFRVPSMPAGVHNWFRYDIPWLFTVALAWLPAVQQFVHRGETITLRLDQVNAVCDVETGRYSGTWKLHKRSPRDMTSAKVFAPFGLLLIAGMILLNLMTLHRAIHPPTLALGFPETQKIMAVQGLCQAVLLLRIFVPLVSYWRSPYLVALRQRGRWLSLQYR